MIGLVTEEGGEGEEGEEKAIVRSAPDGSDNKVQMDWSSKRY